MTVLIQAGGCAVRCARLIVRRQLHLRHDQVGKEISLPDGRTYVVFRESTRDDPIVSAPVMLAVWFRLRTIPPGARMRRWLFERLCLLNTLLFAGFDGYLVKLWMVNPMTSDYAGLYSWRSADEAEVYARYITAILRPLSTVGSVGYQIVREQTLESYLSDVRRT